MAHQLGGRCRVLQLVSIPANYDMAPKDEIWKDRVYDKVIPIRAGMTVVDVGASIGIFSLYASEQVGASGRVIAFEPEPESYNALVENTRDSGNVTAVQKAAWNQRGESTLFPTRILTGSTLLPTSGVMSQSFWFPSDKKYTVETCRLDEALPALGVNHVDFVKIDAEGAANKILEGTTGIISEIDNFAIAAYHARENLREMIQFLEAYGFRTVTLHGNGITPFVYATRNPNLSLAYVETWQVGVAVSAVGLLSYMVWKGLK